jgi:hypothetical protein
MIGTALIEFAGERFGSKATCTPQELMSALLLKADIGAAQINVYYGQ